MESPQPAAVEQAHRSVGDRTGIPALGQPPGVLKTGLPKLEPAGSAAALARLNAAIGEPQIAGGRAARPPRRGSRQRRRPDRGARWAIKALDKDEANGAAGWCPAFARERSGTSPRLVLKALALLPDNTQIPNDLARLAMHGHAGARGEAPAHQREPDNPEGATAPGQRGLDKGRYDENIDLLKAIIAEHPANAMLWNTRAR